ncbi:hypothetical protein GQR58_015026 [Nymphon striatum]|nr:hypothetical protein GQR58_015026 [Nymphon striatum]
MYQAFQPNASSKIWEPGAHKKEVKFSLDARKTLHTTHISKSIGIISADNNAECTHIQCVPSISTLRVLKKFGSPETHKKGTEIPVGCQENLAHNKHFLVDLNNFCRQQRKMSPSTKCTKHFNLTRPQKIWELGAHKKEVKFSLDARKTLHTTHIYKSIGIISADNNAECTHLQCVPSIPTLRVGMLGTFCRCVYSALLSAEIIPID